MIKFDTFSVAPSITDDCLKMLILYVLDTPQGAKASKALLATLPLTLTTVL
jgi:hypothetical protein